MVECVRGFFGREYAVDDRLQPACVEERDGVVSEGLDGARFLLQRADAQNGAEEAGPLPHQLPEGEGALRACARADNHDSALRRKCVKVTIEIRRADQLEDD